MPFVGTVVAAPTTLAALADAGLGPAAALPQAEYVPGRILVRFKPAQQPSLRRLAGIPAALPGMSFQRAVGAGRASDAASAAAMAMDTSTDAVHLFSITDGSSVPAKLAQLRKLSGLLHSGAAPAYLR